MAIQANFLTVVNGLAATFTDSSIAESNILPITSWLWDFGDTGTSSLQNPTHTYTAPGIYIVRLTVSDGTNTVYTIKFLSFTSSTTPNLSLSIISQVQCKLPMYTDMDCMANAIKKWQLMLQISPEPAIADADVFDETKWPTLFNALITSLVVYELLLELFNQYSLIGASNSLNASSSSSSSSTTNTNSTRGSLKKLETGPSNAEWYNPTDGNTVDSGSKLLAAYFRGGDGFIDQYKAQICMLANRLSIAIPEICGKRFNIGPVIKVGRTENQLSVFQLTTVILNNY